MYDAYRSCKQALREVHVILDNTNLNDVSKIPLSFITFIEENEDTEYNPNITFDKPLSEQKLKMETLDILSMLYLNYWCETKEKKQEYQESLKKNEEKLKEQYKNTLNFDKKDETDEIIEENQMLVEVKKETWFARFISWIKRGFKK